MKKTKITLYNDFHSTEVNLIMRGDTLSKGQIKRARWVLCPSRSQGCTCGDWLGCRGPQEWVFEPLYAGGEVAGAVLADIPRDGVEVE